MHLFPLSFSLMCNQYSDFKKNVLLNKAWILRCFLAGICADLLRFFSLPTFMTEAEGLGWLTGPGVRAMQRQQSFQVLITLDPQPALP